MSAGGDEPLNPFARLHLTGVDIPARVGRDHVKTVELASVVARTPDPAHDLPVVAVEYPDRVVLDV